MSDKHGFIILGKRQDGGLTWFDDLTRRDNFQVGDIVYLAGKAQLVESSPLDRYGRKFTDVTDEYMTEINWREYLDLDETYEAIREATR